MARQQPVVIVGAGVTGLSLALMLQESGIPTVVIEKEDRAGGLARSFEYVDEDLGEHFMCSDSFVRIEDPGPNSIGFNRMRFTYLGDRCP